MKALALLAFSAAALSACAANQRAPMAETGYAPGALAIAAIERGDWARAEQLLTDPGRGDADDPARLINLGEVYWRTGREAEAIAVWRRALASDRHVDVDTLGGRTVSTYQLAREALAAHDAGLRTAAR
jgi:tetratricopeptide (TPR) repeat protein